MGRHRIVADPQDIVQTAYTLIDKDGYDSFSARKLAQGLGLSHMTVYNYLAREELLDEVIIMGFGELNKGIMPQGSAYIAGEGDPCVVFKRASEALLSFALEHPNMYRFMFQSGIGARSQDPRVRELYTRGMEFVRDTLSPERYEELRKDAYLFLVLTNGLILGYLGRRRGLGDDECRLNIARGYELLLGRHCGAA
jgi:AcrR family transcriptional regulator